MPYQKKDEKTLTTEQEESDTEDQSIDEECTGKAEWMQIFFTFSKLSFRLLSSFDVAL